MLLDFYVLKQFWKLYLLSAIKLWSGESAQSATPCLRQSPKRFLVKTTFNSLLETSKIFIESAPPHWRFAKLDLRSIMRIVQSSSSIYWTFVLTNLCKNNAFLCEFVNVFKLRRFSLALKVCFVFLLLRNLLVFKNVFSSFICFAYNLSLFNSMYSMNTFLCIVVSLRNQEFLFGSLNKINKRKKHQQFSKSQLSKADVEMDFYGNNSL